MKWYCTELAAPAYAVGKGDMVDRMYGRSWRSMQVNKCNSRHGVWGKDCETHPDCACSLDYFTGGLAFPHKTEGHDIFAGCLEEAAGCPAYTCPASVRGATGPA